MPAQKGKKRKRPRHRSGTGSPAVAPAAPRSREPAGARPARQRRQQPFWVSLLIGAALAVVGIVFYEIPQKGASLTEKLIFLVLYLILGGFYLGRGYLQYRRTHGS